MQDLFVYQLWNIVVIYFCYLYKWWLDKILLQKSNEIELQAAWDRFMTANDRWKDIEAQKQAKVEVKVCAPNLCYNYLLEVFVSCRMFN